MSVQPWPISSIVRLPQPIHAVGSGLWLIGGRVVVVRDGVEDGAGREQMRRLVGVDNLPVLLVAVSVGQHFPAPVRVDRFENHAAAAEVHVRLEADDQRRLRQRPVAIVPRDGVRRNAQERGAVQRVLGDQRAGRHGGLVDVELHAGAQHQILDPLAVVGPVVADAGPNAV